MVIMNGLKRKIKLIGLKFYLSLFKFFYSNDDKDAIRMRQELFNIMDQCKKGGPANNIGALRKEIECINYKLNLIMDYYIDPAAAKPAKGALELLQRDMLEIMLVFKDIADNHNIPYWLDYGTLLGSVRHNGFIPWDSDVDVSIMESELPRLVEILNEELPEEYEFVPYWLDRVYRVRKKNNASEAFMDVYPYLIYGRDSEGNYKIRMRHGGDNPRVNTYRPHRPFPSNILFPLSQVTFCGHTFNAPSDIDSYLRLKYGNYHVLPKSQHMEPGHPVLREDIIFYPEDFVK